MRKSILIAVLLSAFCFEFAAPPRAQAQGFGQGEATVVVTYDQKRVRRKRQIYGMAGTIFVALIGGVFIMMNAIDRRAARRAQERRLQERQEQGLL